MDTISKLIFSLEQLEVKGKRNLDILLGCIIALEQLKDDQIKEEESEEDGR